MISLLALLCFASALLLQMERETESPRVPQWVVGVLVVVGFACCLWAMR